MAIWQARRRHHNTTAEIIDITAVMNGNIPDTFEMPGIRGTIKNNRHLIAREVGVVSFYHISKPEISSGLRGAGKAGGSALKSLDVRVVQVKGAAGG